MARKNAFNPNPVLSPSPLSTTGKRPALPKGSAGALAQGIREATRDGLREIDPELIDASGITDRMGGADEDDAALAESIRTYGQMVPCLLRPSTSAPGRFEVIYGRRRVVAARSLGVTVKAIVKTLEDEDAVIVQGQENATRRDLSFIEKARFAHSIVEDYSRDVAMKALNVHKSLLSRMMTVSAVIDDDITKAIGPCHSIGRDRWLDLVEQVNNGTLSKQDIRALLARPEIHDLPSAERFDAVMRLARDRATVATKEAPKAQMRKIVSARTQQELGHIRRSSKTLTLSIGGGDPAFAGWLDAHADALINDLHARYLEEETGAEDPEESSNDKEAQAR